MIEAILHAECPLGSSGALAYANAAARAVIGINLDAHLRTFGDLFAFPVAGREGGRRTGKFVGRKGLDTDGSVRAADGFFCFVAVLSRIRSIRTAVGALPYGHTRLCARLWARLAVCAHTPGEFVPKSLFPRGIRIALVRMRLETRVNCFGLSKIGVIIMAQHISIRVPWKDNGFSG